MLAAVSLVTIPLVVAVTFLVARRSQVQFAAEWDRTGTLNGLVEETHTGTPWCRSSGGARRPSRSSAARTGTCTTPASGRSSSGIIQPSMQFIANLDYVVIAVLGGYRVASGFLSLGDVQAFIQYSRQFTMPITQIASQMNMPQSGMALAVAGLRVPRRRGGDCRPRLADVARRRSGWNGERGKRRARLLPLRAERALIEDFDLEVARGKRWPSSGRGAGKTTTVDLLVRFYEVGAGTSSTGSIRKTSPATKWERAMVLEDTGFSRYDP